MLLRCTPASFFDDLKRKGKQGVKSATNKKMDVRMEGMREVVKRLVVYTIARKGTKNFRRNPLSPFFLFEPSWSVWKASASRQKTMIERNQFLPFCPKNNNKQQNEKQQQQQKTKEHTRPTNVPPKY